MFENIEKALTIMMLAIGVKLDGEDEQVKKRKKKILKFIFENWDGTQFIIVLIMKKLPPITIHFHNFLVFSLYNLPCYSDFSLFSFQINESRYIALILVSGYIKKLISIDCVNIYFSQSIDNNVFSIFFQ